MVKTVAELHGGSLELGDGPAGGACCVVVSVRISAVRDRYGRVVGVSSADRDISRMKQTERKLMEADRQKDEFIARRALPGRASTHT